MSMAASRDAYIEDVQELVDEKSQQAEVRQLLLDLMDAFEQSDLGDALYSAFAGFEEYFKHHEPEEPPDPCALCGAVEPHATEEACPEALRMFDAARGDAGEAVECGTFEEVKQLYSNAEEEWMPR